MPGVAEKFLKKIREKLLAVGRPAPHSYEELRRRGRPDARGGASVRHPRRTHGASRDPPGWSERGLQSWPADRPQAGGGRLRRGPGPVHAGAAPARVRRPAGPAPGRRAAIAGSYAAEVGIPTMTPLSPQTTASTANVFACATARLSRPSWQAIPSGWPLPTTGTQIPSSSTAEPCSATRPTPPTPFRTPSSSPRPGSTDCVTRVGCVRGCTPSRGMRRCGSSGRRSGRRRSARRPT